MGVVAIVGVGVVLGDGKPVVFGVGVGCPDGLIEGVGLVSQLVCPLHDGAMVNNQLVTDLQEVGLPNLIFVLSPQLYCAYLKSPSPHFCKTVKLSFKTKHPLAILSFGSFGGIEGRKSAAFVATPLTSWNVEKLYQVTTTILPNTRSKPIIHVFEDAIDRTTEFLE